MERRPAPPFRREAGSRARAAPGWRKGLPPTARPRRPGARALAGRVRGPPRPASAVGGEAVEPLLEQMPLRAAEGHLFGQYGAQGAGGTGRHLGSRHSADARRIRRPPRTKRVAAGTGPPPRPDRRARAGAAAAGAGVAGRSLARCRALRPVVPDVHLAPSVPRPCPAAGGGRFPGPAPGIRRGTRQATQRGREAVDADVRSGEARAAARRAAASRRVAGGRVKGMRRRCSKTPGSVAKHEPPSMRTP